ncbi:MAG TPA: hypothetical protein VJZ27_05210, partial [Aggregatilineales bacterium]|nr:hypothetical protein [Aggregatilineales bacterium]
MKQTHLPDKFYSGSITVVVVSAIMSVLVQLWLGFDISQFSHSLIGDRGDTVLNSAFLYQALDNLLHRPLHPGYMPMFYNEPNAFWYSIAPYGIAAVTLPVYLLSGENIVLTHNLYVIFSTVATAWIGFLLTYYLLPVSRFFAVLAGLMIAFATWRTGEIPHIETLSFQFPLLALYCLHRLIDTPRRRWAVGLALAFWLTMNTSGYLMWVFLMSGIVVMLYLLLRRRRFITRHFIALMMFAIVLATVISAPFIIGKWQNDVLRRGFGRDNINDISANPEEFLDSTALIYWKRLPGFGDQKLFIGFLPIIFSLAALWHYRRSSKTPESDHAFSTRDILILYAVIVVVGYVLMLGPDLTLSSGEDTH